MSQAKTDVCGAVWRQNFSSADGAAQNERTVHQQRLVHVIQRPYLKANSCRL